MFGGPVQTPTFQRLADEGLRYNTFHTTALCSPTRAALITGRNHHSCASGVITEFATGYPGYNSLVPRSCGSVGEVLRENGYHTAWFGKMHNEIGRLVDAVRDTGQIDKTLIIYEMGDNLASAEGTS